MLLAVKQDGRTIDEFQFAKGPVYIGRHTNSQIFLPDRSVSRQHAVIFTTRSGKWIAEDLDSANKTYLNDTPIHKAEIKTGDVLRITNYTIEINLEFDTEIEKPIDLEDTLTTPLREAQVIIRRAGTEHAPPVKLSAKRIKDFLEATEAICEADGLDEILQTLLRIIAKQFAVYHIWCALRDQPTGPMSCHAGKSRDGSPVQINQLKLNEKIDEAVEKKQFILLPQLSTQLREEKINSAMIAPLVSTVGCFGVLYIDNAMDHERYGLGDLDYLILLAIHTAAILKNF